MYIKALLPKGTEYTASFNDTPYRTEKDYYTTINVEEKDLNSDSWIQHLAKRNLTATIAEKEFADVRCHVNIWFDMRDIKILRNTNVNPSPLKVKIFRNNELIMVVDDATAQRFISQLGLDEIDEYSVEKEDK